MRHSIFKLAALAVAIVFLSLNVTLADHPANVDWDKFSNSLVKSLKSDNEGVRLSAMQLVIKYGDKVNVSSARYEVMDTFMNHDNQKVRQMALVTLYKINNVFDMGLLERQYKFEEDPVIQNQLAAILIEADRLGAPKAYPEYSETKVASVTAP